MQAHSAKRSNAPRTSGPGRPRSPAADGAILSAALELFVEHGIDGASIDQIAKRARVARTTLYRRWSSKEALIAQAIAVGRGTLEQQAATNRPGLTNLGGRLVDAFVETVTAPNYRKIVARLVGSLPRYPDLMSVYWHTYLAPRREILVQLLERGRAEGLIRQESDAEILLDLIGGAMMYHLLIPPGQRTSTEMRAYLLRVLRELGLSDAADGTPPRRRRTQRVTG